MRKKKKIKIIIADDHTIVRWGIKQIVADCDFMEEADEANNGQELLQKARKNKYDAILLDIAMPGRDGIEILKQLKAEKISAPVLMLSIYPEEQYAIRSLKAGASGYLTKETAPEELIEAIKKITSGGKYITQKIAEHLADIIDLDTNRLPHELLTDREFKILCMIASGISLTDIASSMFLHAKTVSTYRRRILQKMNLKNNSELTHYAIKNNLLD